MPSRSVEDQIKEMTDVFYRRLQSEKQEEQPMAAKKKATNFKLPPIYTWAFESSKPVAGGRIVTYVTRIEHDGTLSCNCAGWTIKRPGKERGCKHTKAVAVEAKDIMKRFKAGEKFEVFEATLESKKSAGADAPEETFQYNRKVEI